MIHHVVGRAGHVAGLTHVVLVLGSQSVLSLVQAGLLGDFVLVLDPFTMVGEQRGHLGEVAEMALEYKTNGKFLSVKPSETDREDRMDSGLPAHLLAS